VLYAKDVLNDLVTVHGQSAEASSARWRYCTQVSRVSAVPLYRSDAISSRQVSSVLFGEALSRRYMEDISAESGRKTVEEVSLPDAIIGLITFNSWTRYSIASNQGS